MKSSLWLFLVLKTLAIIHIVRSQDQQGFISLDCGLPASELSPYKEEFTGLQFSSDATFIQSGQTGRVQENPETNLLKPYRTLRYFREGIRNCYNLNVTKGRTHLIRARFVYGNYDGLDNSPKFDLYLGPNPWTTIDLHGQEDGKTEEIIHIPTSNSLQICLVKTGISTPVISALEIRPLGNDSYITQSGSLKLYFRNYLSKSENTLRYPDDVYDRHWLALFQKEWTQISTTSNVVYNNNHEVPKKALANAVIPTNASEPLNIEWTNSDDHTAHYYVYGHFAEIQDLGDNDTREFNMVWNGELISSEPVIPRKHKLYTIFSKSPKSCQGGKCSFQLIRTKRSTLPPLLNAFEVYTFIQFQQSETDESDMNAIKNIITTYKLSNINWQGDPCVPLQLRWDALQCSNTIISTPPRITYLNLSSSRLYGNIAAAIQNLTLLEKLDLSSNNLTGGIPEFLGNMKSLSVINLSGNNLSGFIPQTLKHRGPQRQRFDGNPKLCYDANSCRKPPNHKVKHVILNTLSISTCVVLFALLVYCVCKFINLKNLEDADMPQKTSTTDEIANENGKRFTYLEVTVITNWQRVLGEGGFGKVYHGIVNGTQQVAVKILSQLSSQGYKEFKTEVELLLEVRHRNLVKLMGYCDEKDHLALIYEFLPNGDLKKCLTGESINNWKTRLQIAMDAARGLAYLHTECDQTMVHRDVKTSNILLDQNFNAKLADFGLSRSFQSGDESRILTRVVGTIGYLDPEYYTTKELHVKSDVYSFGIVLLEIITNKPVLISGDPNYHIKDWVERNDCIPVMDQIFQHYDHASAQKALELGIWCTKHFSSDRPSMIEVVNELRECIVLEDNRIKAEAEAEPEDEAEG